MSPLADSPFPPASEELFLCCAVADDPSWHARDLRSLWEAIGDDRAFDAATRNGVTSIAGRALMSVLESSNVTERWRQAADDVAGRISEYMTILDAVADSLAAQGIPLVALKNSGIARALVHDHALNPMGDVDVLIRRADMPRAMEVLGNLGYTLKSRSPLGEANLQEVIGSGGVEYTIPLRSGGSMWLELQWRPVAGRWINEAQEPPAEILIERSLAVPGTAARVLSAEDNLLQVCLHTAKHSYVRAPGFRLHTDVDRIVRRCDVDWSRFEETVRRLRVKTAVYYSLWLSAILLRTPVPADLLSRLRPAAWKHRQIVKLLSIAGLFDPDVPKWRRLEYLRFSALLYDSASPVWRSVFPSPAWMLRRYGANSAVSLPWLYLRRLFDLAWNRTTT